MNLHKQIDKRVSCWCLLTLTALVLAGCASTQVRDCKAIAGSGWTVLKSPPADAARILSLQGLSSGHSIVWMRKSPKQVLACNYQVGLVSPGCSNSRAYVFKRGSQGWKSAGVLLSACNVDQ